MKTAKLFSATLLGLLFIFSSCNKYEEGPKVSVLTKKMRLTGTWTPVKIIEEGEVELFSDKDVNIVFKKDNTYIDRSGSVMIEGKWEFNGDKTEIIVSNTGTIQFGVKREILRLTNKELWLKDGDEEVHYEKI